MKDYAQKSQKKWIGGIGQKLNILLMQDIAIPQTCGHVENMLEIETMQRKKNPPYSPHLKIIEHVWSTLRQHIALTAACCLIIRELKNLIL